MLRRLLIALGASISVFALLGGCFHDQIPLDIATPQASSSPSPTTSATAPPATLIDEVGNGQDGPGNFGSGGVVFINNCAGVADASGTTVNASEDVSPLDVGAMIVVLQVQSDLAANVGDQTNVVDPPTGAWDLARVEANDGMTLSVDPPLTFAYSTGTQASAQLCHVPEFTDVTIANATVLSAPGWNPTLQIGGVLAFFASGTVSVCNACEISGGTAGFSGGFPSLNGPAENVTAAISQPDEGGGKGTGAHRTSPAVLTGRGNYVNGAGGGNGRNGGGGGGGLGGAGGYGGKQRAESGDNPDTRGFPGVAVNASPVLGRLLFGGGGGGGHQDDGEGGFGGAGGGIVLIRAAVLTGSGTLRAEGDNGDDAGNGVLEDGAGGGGSGGTVIVYADDATGFSGNIEAEGGDGGDVLHSAGDLERCGPGGGGGGGRIYSNAGSAQYSVNPGLHGNNLNTLNEPEWGSTDGLPGVVETF